MNEKNIRMPELAKVGIDLVIFLATLGLIMYGTDTILDSQNKLSEIKEKFLATPPISAQCDPNDKLAMDCMKQISKEVCDGNNTLSRNDDLCETLDYWDYMPVFNMMR